MLKIRIRKSEFRFVKKHTTLPAAPRGNLLKHYIEQQPTQMAIPAIQTMELPAQHCMHPERQAGHRYCSFCGYAYTQR